MSDEENKQKELAILCESIVQEANISINKMMGEESYVYQHAFNTHIIAKLAALQYEINKLKKIIKDGKQ